MGLTQITTGGVDDNINIDSNTLKVDGTNNRVGIGTSSPSALLHVARDDGSAAEFKLANTEGTYKLSANSNVVTHDSEQHLFRNAAASTEYARIHSSGRLLLGTTTEGQADADDLTIAGSGNTGITIRSGTTSHGAIYFSRGTSGNDEYNGFVDYDQDDNYLRLGVAGAEKLRIDSSGNVGVKSTNPLAQLHILNSSGTSGFYLSRANGTTIGDQPSVNIIADSAKTRIYGYGDALTFWTAATGGTASERMRIDSSGQVGIGSSSPGHELVVRGSQPFLELRSSDTGNHAGEDVFSGILFGTDDTSTSVDPHGFIKAVHTRAGSGHSSADAGLTFGTSASTTAPATERMRIDSSGNIGIGTTSPTNYTDHVSLVLAGKAGQGAGRLDFNDTSGNKDASIFADNGRLFLDADPDSATASSSIQLRVDGGTTRVRIDSNGAFRTLGTNTSALAVRNTAAAGTSVSNFVGLHTATNNDNGTVSIRIYTNGNIQNTNNSYGSLSDEKLKENIVDSGSQWDDIKDIRVRKYNFKASTNYETFTQLGVIAQEVETVSPGLVSEVPDTDDEGNDLGTTTKAVNYSVLYMKAVKALQEAMDRIETLEAKVAALEAAE